MSPTPPPAETRKRSTQWLVVIAVAAALTLALVSYYFLALRQSYVALYTDLRSSEAAAIVAVLDEEGVRYRLEDSGARIMVPAAQADALRLRLSSAEISTGGRQGFELFDQSDMGLTDFAQKIRYQRALQGELARTIMMIDGVAEARVHISMPERTLFRGERRSAEAAVTLVMRAREEETHARIEGVRRLVAASVPDLAIGDVVVLNAHGEVISTDTSTDEFATGADADLDGTSSSSVAYVMALTRQALPEQRFEVSVEGFQPTLAGDESLEPGAGHASIISITTESALTATEMEQVSQVLRDAQIVDGDSGGTLSFLVRPAAPAEPIHTRAAATHMPAQERPTWTLVVTQTIPAVIAALIVAIILLVTWRKMRRPRLAPEEHASFAERLKEVLHREADGARDV